MSAQTVQPKDHNHWFRMKKALWPDCPDDTLRAEMASILADDRQAVLVAVRDGGGLGGFGEVSIHPHALKSSVVALFPEPHHASHATIQDMEHHPFPEPVGPLAA